jgi:hypothetical protein
LSHLTVIAEASVFDIRVREDLDDVNAGASISAKVHLFLAVCFGRKNC